LASINWDVTLLVMVPIVVGAALLARALRRSGRLTGLRPLPRTPQEEAEQKRRGYAATLLIFMPVSVLLGWVVWGIRLEESLRVCGLTLRQCPATRIF
jgi:hypothetical protein